MNCKVGFTINCEWKISMNVLTDHEYLFIWSVYTVKPCHHINKTYSILWSSNLLQIYNLVWIESVEMFVYIKKGYIWRFHVMKSRFMVFHIFTRVV